MSGPSGELAGRLGERVTIERRDARDALGAASGGWQAIAIRRARIEPDGSGDALAGEAASAAARFRVTLRIGAPLLFGDRLAWRGWRLAVRSIRDDPALPDRIVVLVEEIR